MDELVIRDLLPWDLGLGSWGEGVFPYYEYEESHQQWYQWVNHKTDSNKIIGIYKIIQLSAEPTATEIKIGLGHSCSTTLGVHPLEPCYARIPTFQALVQLAMEPEAREVMERLIGRTVPIEFEPAEGWFSQPYVFSCNDWVSILLKRFVVFGERPTHVDKLALSGFVVERRGGI